MFKIIDPQNISQRSFTSNKKFTVTNNDSGSFGNFTIRAISGSHHNYVSASDTITHIISGSVTSSYYSFPTYGVIKKLYYNDINKRFNTKKLQKTELFDNANVFSIPRNLIGERIKPGTIKLTDTSLGQTFDIRDDEDGNLYDYGNFSGSYAAYKSSSFDRSEGINVSGSGSQVGNVFYEHGIMTITDTGSYRDVGLGSAYTLDFQATQKHYEYEYVCSVGQYEFNSTMNISATKDRSGSISITDSPESQITDITGKPILDKDGRKQVIFSTSPYSKLPPGSAPKGELIINGKFDQIISGNKSTVLGAWSTDGTATLFTSSNVSSDAELILSASVGDWPTSKARASQTLNVKKGKEYLLTGEYRPGTNLANGGFGQVYIGDDNYFSSRYRATSSRLLITPSELTNSFQVPFTATSDTHYVLLAMLKNQQHDDTIWDNISLKEWHGFESGIGDYDSEYKATQYYENFVTHSEFRPYVTQVGLYDEQNRLLAHAKLGKPIKLDDQYDTSFVVRFDV